MVKLLSNVRFGPAGNPLGYKGETVNVCNYIHKRGLEAYEYQASYGVRISKQSALKLKKNAKVNDVMISIHAPYYINLSSNKDDVIERSIQRLIQSAKACNAMNACRIALYRDFILNIPKDAMIKLHSAVNILNEKLDSIGVSNYNLRT